MDSGGLFTIQEKASKEDPEEDPEEDLRCIEEFYGKKEYAINNTAKYSGATIVSAHINALTKLKYNSVENNPINQIKFSWGYNIKKFF